MSYLGIDIGTTGCKAVVFDGEGHALSQAYREYATLSPQQGWFELDPKQVMAACRQTIAEVRTELATPSNDLGMARVSDADVRKYLQTLLAAYDDGTINSGRNKSPLPPPASNPPANQDPPPDAAGL